MIGVKRSFFTAKATHWEMPSDPYYWKSESDFRILTFKYPGHVPNFDYPFNVHIVDFTQILDLDVVLPK